MAENCGHHHHHEHEHSHHADVSHDHDAHGEAHSHRAHEAHHHHHHHVHFSAEMSLRHRKVLRRVFLLTALYLGVEIVGGLVSGSLALLADGFHMFADAAAIGLSFFAAWLSHRPAPANHTFGYQRAEILAAFANALFLLGIGGFILWESVQRFYQPEPVKAEFMSLIAVGGLIVNIIAARLLHADHEHNLNIRGAYLHVLGDLLGSLGAVLAGLLIQFFHWNWADPAVSLVIALLIMYSAFGLIRDSVNVLMEGCPAHIDVAEVQADILEFPGVEAVHQLHVWNINLHQTLMTVHVAVQPSAYSAETLSSLQALLKEKYALSHVTMQLEAIERF